MQDMPMKAKSDIQGYIQIFDVLVLPLVKFEYEGEELAKRVDKTRFAIGAILEYQTNTNTLLDSPEILIVYDDLLYPIPDHVEYKFLSPKQAREYMCEAIILRDIRVTSNCGEYEIVLQSGEKVFIDGFSLDGMPYTVLDGIEYDIDEGYYALTSDFEKFFKQPQILTV